MGVPQCCPFTLPDFHLPKKNWADSGTTKSKSTQPPSLIPAVSACGNHLINHNRILWQERQREKERQREREKLEREREEKERKEKEEAAAAAAAAAAEKREKERGTWTERW